jgi:hypothetical protein
MAYGEASYSAVAGGGTAEIQIRTRTNRDWTVSQISIEMATAVAGAVCTMRKNGTFVTYLVPNGDAAGGDPPILLRAVDVITITWTGVTNGVVGKAFVIYDDGEAQP